MFRPSFLVIDKPVGVTSHDIVAMVRAVTGCKKVGHTGTLDPFATGVLPLAIGPATKLISFLDESLKVYDAVIEFGTSTDTGDPTGEVVKTGPVPRADHERVLAVLASFVGEQLQQPPAYSAVKYKGKPLYYYARKGLHVEVPARPITIYGLECLEYTQNTLRVLIQCSRGTYARVLAQDIAEALGSVGHLKALRRPRSGPFTLERSLDIPTLAAMVAEEEGHSWEDVFLKRGPKTERVPWKHRDVVRASLSEHMMLPIEVLSHYETVRVNEAEAKHIRNGGQIPVRFGRQHQNDGYIIVHNDRVLALSKRTANGIKNIRLLSNA